MNNLGSYHVRNAILPDWFQMHFANPNPTASSGAEFQQYVTADSSCLPANTSRYRYIQCLPQSMPWEVEFIPAPFGTAWRCWSMTLQPGKRLVWAGGKEKQESAGWVGGPAGFQGVCGAGGVFVLTGEVSRCPGEHTGTSGSLRDTRGSCGLSWDAAGFLQAWKRVWMGRRRSLGSTGAPGKADQASAVLALSVVALLLVNPKGSGEGIGGENSFPREYRLKIIDG